MNIHLMTQYYLDDCPKRQEELDYCIRVNAENPFIHTVHLFTTTSKNFKHPKIRQISANDRLKFNDYFGYANENLCDDICVIINTDIILDNTISMLHKLEWRDLFICLTRHEIATRGTVLEWDKRIGVGKKCATHDAWAFTPPIDLDADFYLGVLGCDGRLVYLLNQAGYNVHNPAAVIKIYHYHLTGKRNYDKKNIVKGKRGNTIITDVLP